MRGGAGRRARIGACVVAAALAIGVRGTAGAAETVQIPVEALLNARSVTTLTGGALVTWTMGVDGGGAADGYLTAAASRFQKDPAAIKALPDDGRFPADNRHPDVALHFSNDADAASQQTHFVKGAGEFSFATPAGQYEKLFLILTSSEGASALKVTLTYADATTDTVSQSLPDYYNPIAATDPVFFNLALDLAKWNKQNKIAETNHHFIDGMEIHPAASKTLTGVTVAKTAGGYLLFWGATGVVTGSIDGGSAGGDVPPTADAGSAVDGGDAPSDIGATGGSGQTGSGGAGGGAAGAGGSGAAGSGGAGTGAGGPGVSAGASSSGCTLSSSTPSLPSWWTWMLLAGLFRRSRASRR